MFDTTTPLTFVLAGGAIIIAPAPAQALVLARTLSDGRRRIVAALGLNVAPSCTRRPARGRCWRDRRSPSTRSK